MSSKIEVPRQLALKILESMNGQEEWLAGEDELALLLAAPVVERQPVAWGTMQPSWPDHHRTLITDKSQVEEYNRQCYELTAFYTAPPELAELQATNKRLTETIQHMIDQTIPLVPDENNPMWSRRITIDELQATIADLQTELVAIKDECIDHVNLYKAWTEERETVRAEIERLKGGQGEPVAFRRFDGEGNFDYWDDEDGKGGSINFPVEPLYTSQPAPVSVVLPERFYQIMTFLDGSGPLDGIHFGEFHKSGRKFWWRTELRACLDKAKELNQ